MNTLFYFRFSRTTFVCFSVILLLSISTQIKAQLTVSAVKDTVSTCLKANFKIRITTNAPTGATFAWKGPGGYVSNEQDASINNLTTIGKGVYTVRVSSGGQFATATSCVKLNDISVGIISGTNICVGQNLRLKDAAVRPADENPIAYLWTGPNNYSSTASSTDIPTTEDLKQLGEYSLTETYDNGCMVTASLTPTISKCLSIGNLVWQDMNNDGLNNNGEVGLGNVTVRLYRAKFEGGIPTNIPDGIAIQTTTTDAVTGKYIFRDLVPNSYIVEIDTPLGYSSSVGVNGSPTGIYEPSNKANDDINDDDDGTMIAGQKIRTNYITLSNFGEPKNDGDVINGTDEDRNSNLTIDFGVYRIPVPICSTEPKCSPILVRKTN
jgi:hypothetical protein